MDLLQFGLRYHLWVGKLTGSKDSNDGFLVPVFVSNYLNVADDLIIGFNVVGEVINAKHKEKQDIIAKVTLFSVDSCTAKTFIQTMHTHHSSDDE